MGFLPRHRRHPHCPRLVSAGNGRAGFRLSLMKLQQKRFEAIGVLCWTVKRRKDTRWSPGVNSAAQNPGFATSGLDSPGPDTSWGLSSVPCVCAAHAQGSPRLAPGREAVCAGRACGAGRVFAGHASHTCSQHRAARGPSECAGRGAGAPPARCLVTRIATMYRCQSILSTRCRRHSRCKRQRCWQVHRRTRRGAVTAFPGKGRPRGRFPRGQQGMGSPGIPSAPRLQQVSQGLP